MSERPATSDRPGCCSTRAAAACAGATGLGFALAAPPFALWPLAGVCLAPLMRALVGRSAVQRLRLGAATGLLAALASVVAPLGSALAAYFELPMLPALGAAFAVSGVFAAAGFGLFALLAGGEAALTIPRAGRLAAAWVAGDLLRSHLLTGLPWLLLGHLLAPVPELCQLAAFGGTALVSFWLAALNACLAGASIAPGVARPWWRAAAVLAVGVGLSLALVPSLAPSEPGFVGRDDGPSDSGLSVALVQPALPNRWQLGPDELEDSLGRLRDLSASAGPVGLLVWPENAVPVYLPANAEAVVDPILEGAEAPAHLLLGAPRASEQGAETFNSVFLYQRSGVLVGVHDKVHRVPFTEYTPALLRGWLPAAPANLEAGVSPRVLETGSLRIGPLVCYELLFAGIARSLVADGAEVLVNLSHDGYFGGRAGARQHTTAAVLRAIELRRPLLRATSDGLTVAIDAGGRVRAALPAREPGVLRLRVVPSSHRSAYARFGDLFGWLAAAGALAASAASWKRR